MCTHINYCYIIPAELMCGMVLHRAFRARHVRKAGIGSEVRHGATSGVSCETYMKTSADTCCVMKHVCAYDGMDTSTHVTCAKHGITHTGGRYTHNSSVRTPSGHRLKITEIPELCFHHKKKADQSMQAMCDM